jgi:DNA-binding HxlR family transcriptional regulator
LKEQEPSNGALAVVEDILAVKWTLTVMRVLADGPVRFSGIRLALPAVSANVLTARLRALEEAGIVRRWMLPPPADCQVYGLSERGQAARPILRAVARWASLLQEDRGLPGTFPVEGA